MEGTAYVLAAHPDAEVERRMTWLIGEIAKAQEPDGYLYTARTLGHHLDAKAGWARNMMGPVRWSHLEHSHELYNVGHMYEAAVAWGAVMGSRGRDFLDVAVRSADLVDRTFGPGPTQLKGVPGHEEIELALVRLYRATGERRYLDLARFFLDRRGHGVRTRDGKVFAQDGSLVDADKAPGHYAQNHMPVREQREAVGHAVRANYLYCGMAGVAALREAKMQLGQGAMELAALSLREAQHSLAEITGDEADERLLDRVFSRFCVGK